ncbi:MAG: SRPBCC family protein [Pseudonocardiaceae bacterium]
MDRGTYLEYHGRPAVRFQRIYPHAIERVWAAVTEPEQLSHWFPSTVTIEPRTRGTITFSDDPHAEPTTGTILIFDPPRHLVFTWHVDELHFELEPVGDTHCQLTLINILAARDTAARNAAGWSVCLAELDKHVAGALGTCQTRWDIRRRGCCVVSPRFRWLWGAG